MKIGRQCVFWAGGVRQTAPWQQINVRGNIISIDNTIEEGTRLAAFEPNQRSQGDESDAAK